MRGLYGNLLLPGPRALMFMQDVAAGDAPSRLKARTAQPARETVTIEAPNGPMDVDVYLPREGARAGLLLIPGVAKDGKDDPRLQRFATTLARSGFGVTVPDLASLRELVVRADHYRDVLAGFEYMRARPDLAPQGRAGIGGLSFAIGPGLRAALDPAICDHVRFIFCIGGYHDIVEQVRFVTTGAFRLQPGPWRFMPHDHYGAWVVAASMARHVTDPVSRDTLRQMVDRRIPDREADLSDLVPALDPDGQALFALVQNTDPDRVDALFSALPTLMRDDLLAMNLSQLDLGPLKARLILVHGYEDQLIPYSESLALYRRAPARQRRLYLLNGLGHVNLQKPGPMDGWALASSVTALLREQQR